MEDIRDINCFWSVSVTGKKTNESAVWKVEFQ